MLLLLTSGLDISKKRIEFLNDFYYDSSTYILWIPIVDDHVAWTTEQYEELRDKIVFQMVDDPQKQVAPNFTRFVKENLFHASGNIGEEPIIVSIDQQGRIVHTNAMHMILTWPPHYIEEQNLRVQKRNNIIPFITKEMNERSQGLNSLIINIDEQISHLVREVDDKINAWIDRVNKEIDTMVCFFYSLIVITCLQLIIIFSIKKKKMHNSTLTNF